MRPHRIWFPAVSLSLFLMAAPGLAHHSFTAAYDLNESIVVEGVVTKVTWANPHVSFQIDVTEQGKKVTWGVDGAPPAALASRGVERTALKPGDVVTVAGAPARYGRPFVAARMVTLADGREAYFGGDGIAR
jgi:hypothetical protein